MLTPSLSQVTHGLGVPTAAQPRVTVEPLTATVSSGLATKRGAVGCDTENWSCFTSSSAFSLRACLFRLVALHWYTPASRYSTLLMSSEPDGSCIMRVSSSVSTWSFLSHMIDAGGFASTPHTRWAIWPTCTDWLCGCCPTCGPTKDTQHQINEKKINIFFISN